MKEEKRPGGWPIEDDELDNVSGGMRGATASYPCPKCKIKGGIIGSGDCWKCYKCGCLWDKITGEILN